MRQAGHQYIGGRYVTGCGGRAPVTDPASGKVLVEVDLAGADDVQAAVAAN